MADLAFVLLIANTASPMIVLLREFLRKGGYVTLPFLVSFLFLTWFLPQAWTLLGHPGLPQERLSRVLLMSLLCFWAMFAGWRFGLGKWRRPETLELPVEKLLIPVFGITLFAIGMRTLIEMQPAHVRAVSQWSGTITILHFFASLSVVSMACSTAMILKSRSFLTVLLFSLNLAVYLPLILIYFRRAEAFEFGLSIMLGLLFVRRFHLPRPILAAFAVAGFFLVNGIGELRSLSGSYDLNPSASIFERLPSIRSVTEIDWLSVADLSEDVLRLEVMNAAAGMEAVTNFSTYTYGAQFWNKMIFSYVPGQFVGHEFKRSLMFGENALGIAREQLYFETKTGTTTTGFLQPFQDFWYFGCFVWWLSGYVMGRLMRRALRGEFIAFALYGSIITNAAHITTHSGYYLFSQSVLLLLGVLFIRWWIKPSVPRGETLTVLQ